MWHIVNQIWGSVRSLHWWLLTHLVSYKAHSVRYIDLCYQRSGSESIFRSQKLIQLLRYSLLFLYNSIVCYGYLLSWPGVKRPERSSEHHPFLSPFSCMGGDVPVPPFCPCLARKRKCFTWGLLPCRHKPSIWPCPPSLESSHHFLPLFI